MNAADLWNVTSGMNMQMAFDKESTECDHVSYFWFHYELFSYTCKWIFRSLKGGGSPMIEVAWMGSENFITCNAFRSRGAASMEHRRDWSKVHQVVLARRPNFGWNAVSKLKIENYNSWFSDYRASYLIFIQLNASYNQLSSKRLHGRNAAGSFNAKRIRLTGKIITDCTLRHCGPIRRAGAKKKTIISWLKKFLEIIFCDWNFS